MDTKKIPLKITAVRFVRAVRNFASSEVGWKAKLMFAELIALLFGINGMNVVNSYVGREFMTAIADRNKAEFIRQALFYIGVFAASTLVAVIARFTEERLALLWREFLTWRAVTLYLADGTYYRLDAAGELGNPDQRIAEDVRAFTVTTLSFVLMLLNSSFTVVAFSSVLWSISPLLFIVAVLYAACGSSLTIVLGRPLVTLNYNQLDKEADFRSALLHVRENAEAIRLACREGRLTGRLLRRLEELVANFRHITAVNRNVGFFTTGYNWLIPIIPALIVAPAFIDGDVAFGVITQSAMAFSLLVGAFSLIVTQFQSISTFAAVVARLSSLVEAIEQSQTTTGSAIEFVEAEGRLAYERLTLLSAQNGSPVLKDLSISIPFGIRVLLTGSNQAARLGLFRATAGLSTAGAGRIMRPGADNMLFLAQRPYLPPGTLRQVLVRTVHAGGISDERIFGLLRQLHLEQVLTRAGGLDVEQDWQTLLSLREQQLLACMHILLAAPQFAFLDRVDTALSADPFHQILHLLSESSITYINNGEADDSSDLYDAVLGFGEDGGWTWTANRAERMAAADSHANESGVSIMNGKTLDDFKDVSGWNAITSGQAQLHISQAQGRRGKAMRLDFDFQGGGGFVVARKLFALALPESYTFGFHMRASAPSNIFEFKLVDESNQNVWRYRQEAFDLPEDWQPLTIKNSQIEFAWGPLGGGPAHAAAAIELVIAAGPGGRGTVWIDDLRFEDTTYRLTPLVRASSGLPGYEAQNVCDPSTATCWRSAASDAPQQLLVDFQTEREYGGLVIQWDKDLRPRAVDIRLSIDGNEWHTVYSAEQGVGEKTYVYLPQTVSRFVRFDLRQSMQGQGFGIVGIEVKPYEFSRSINAFFGAIAQQAPGGVYPKYLLGQQTYWTPVGTGADVTQALFNEEGMVEVDKGAFSIEPFLYIDGRLVAWADVSPTQELEKGYLPIPSSQWQTGDMMLRTTAFATGASGASILYIRYRLANSSAEARQVRLFAAIRPFQVTPTWQHWHGFGGVSAITELAYDAGLVRVNRSKLVIPLTAPSQFGAAAFAQGAITEYLQTGELLPQAAVSDAFGYASGALRYDVDLAPGAVQELYLAIPFGSVDEAGVPTCAAAGLSAAAQFDLAVRQWEAKLGVVDIRLPSEAQGVVDTLKTAAAHILINRDGAALQPGPRRYSRSWIRDGVLMGAALLRMGCGEEMRDFIRWYAGYQPADGNLPDCVDREGCEWLPEYDCWGEFIFAIMDYFRFTGDQAFLAEMWPAVLKSVAFMENLRSQRLTAEYHRAEKRACYGLLPESMSHEGYMAHPVHAYWDDFWALRGLKDAVAMAEILGDQEQVQRLTTFRDTFCDTLYASLNTTIQDRHLDFIPGSVEFADFDPAATAIAIAPVDELHRLPRPAVEKTFEKYLAGFRERVRGDIPWNNYSAYEIRIIGALVRLGRRQDVHELLDYFMADRRIVPWNQWPEISWHDPKGPSFIGDMPHSWISAEYILALRSLFAYEREADQALVIAAGIRDNWLTDTCDVVVTNLPTYYGKLSYTLRRKGPDSLRLIVTGNLALPPGKIVVKPPLPRPLVQVEVNGNTSETFDAESARCGECPAEMIMKY